MYRPSQNYAPSAPPLPDHSNYEQKPGSHSSLHTPSGKPTASEFMYTAYTPPHPSSSYGYSAPPPHPTSGGYSAAAPPPHLTSGGYSVASPPFSGGGGVYFPQGTHPEIIQSFQAVDRDHSGSIDESELQAALSSGYQKFNLRTIRLLIFLFKNPSNPSKIGPVEFAALWSCLGQWRAIFERFDRDRSGEIDSTELRDALLSLGYAVPTSIIQVLILKYDDGSGRRGALNFDSFVECGMIVKGLTEKFKEKDTRYTGSATLTYDAFLSMVIPFLVS